MKTCPRCTLEKDLSEFAKNARRKDGKQVYCKLCVREINAEYYKKTPERNVQRSLHTQKGRHRARSVVGSYLQGKSCVDCGFSNPLALQFDHVRGIKESNVSDLVRYGASTERILAEIAKCDVRCANCHSIKTARDFGWHKLLTEIV